MLKKKHFILIIYAVYVLFLFAVASYYEYLDELPSGPQFFSGFGRGLKYALHFFLFCLFSSWAFFTVLYFMYGKLSIAFVFCTPFLLFFVGLMVYLAGDFILWITQLHPLISEFHEGFMLTTISSTLIMIWFFGDVFKKNEPTRVFNV